MSTVPAIGRQRQGDCFKLKASQGYIQDPASKPDRQMNRQAKTLIRDTVGNLVGGMIA